MGIVNHKKGFTPFRDYNAAESTVLERIVKPNGKIKTFPDNHGNVKRLFLSLTGFTLTELLVAMIIVGVLSAMAVPIFKQNIRRVMATEGHAMAGAIKTAQRIHFSEYNRYTNDWRDLEQSVDIDNNKYFKTAPSMLAGGTGSEANFTATIIGSGDANGIKLSVNHEGTVTIEGL